MTSKCANSTSTAGEEALIPSEYAINGLTARLRRNVVDTPSKKTYLTTIATASPEDSLIVKYTRVLEMRRNKWIILASSLALMVTVVIPRIYPLHSAPVSIKGEYDFGRIQKGKSRQAQIALDMDVPKRIVGRDLTTSCSCLTAKIAEASKGSHHLLLNLDLGHDPLFTGRLGITIESVGEVCINYKIYVGVIE
jgi:hypothetical protein